MRRDLAEQRSHRRRSALAALAQRRVGEPPHDGTTSRAGAPRLGVHLGEEIVWKRDHDLCHAASIPRYTSGLAAGSAKNAPPGRRGDFWGYYREERTEIARTPERVWLAQGDLPGHVEAARRPSPDGTVLASAEIGDARKLPWGKDEADVVLLLGPLYHLTSFADRRKAISEAHRVLRPGGLLLAAGISRLAVSLDGISGAPTGKPEKPLPLKEGLHLVADVLRNGHYANPTADSNMFTRPTCIRRQS